MEILNKLNINKKNVVCYCVPDALDVLEDGISLVIVTSGKFIEISDEKIINEFAFNFSMHLAKQIVIFYSYEPKYKHYIISVDPRTIVVVRKKDNKLSLIKKLVKVTNFYISDHQNIGKPQVVITMQGEVTPLVTDFCDNNLERPTDAISITGLNLGFMMQMNDLNIRIKNAERLLAEKKFIIAQRTSELVNNAEEPVELMYSNLVFAPNEKQETLQKQLSAHDMVIGTPSIKMNSSFWIISYPISNTNSDELSHLNMYLANKGIIVKNTFLFLTGNKKEKVEMSSSLKPTKSAFLTGVLDEPLFVTCSITLKFSVNYKVKGEQRQYFLGDIKLEMADLTSKIYQIQSFKKGFEEEIFVITLMSTSQRTDVFVQQTPQLDIPQILISSLNFTEIGTNYYVNTDENSFFYNILITVKSIYETFIISVYTQTQNQLLLLIQNLKIVFPERIKLLPNISDGCHAIKCLKEELQFVKNVLFQELDTSETNSNQPKPHEILRKLYDLEIKSTNAISSLIDTL